MMRSMSICSFSACSNTPIRQSPRLVSRSSQSTSSARATERGDSETVELAQLLHEIARGLEDEQRDIKRLLQDIQHRLQNLH